MAQQRAAGSGPDVEGGFGAKMAGGCVCGKSGTIEEKERNHRWMQINADIKKSFCVADISLTNLFVD